MFCFLPPFDPSQILLVYAGGREEERSGVEALASIGREATGADLSLLLAGNTGGKWSMKRLEGTGGV
jgi:hypothetical protein